MRSLRRQRLLERSATPSDPRPGLLSIISLLLLLLPFLLLTTSPQKLAALSFRLPAAGEGLPPLPPGPVEELSLSVQADALLLTQALRRTDVQASVGDTERRQLRLAHRSDGFDIPGLQAALRELKSIDPARERITLQPAPKSTAAQVVSLMDAMRADNVGPLFREVVLEATP